MSGPVADGEYAMHAKVRALRGQGRLAEALAAAYHAVTVHPNSTRAHHIYAELLRECGRERDALAVIDEVLRVDPSADALVLRGDLARCLVGAYAAEADYLEALRRHPGHPLAVHNLAVARLRMGTTTAAVRGLLEAVRLDPGLARPALSNIGSALTRVLRWATASIVFLAAALIALTALQDDGQSTGWPRLLAAAATLPMITALIWTVRTVPGPALRAVLRAHWLLGARLVVLAVAAIAGVVVAATGSAGVTGMLLLFAMVGLTVLGWIVGQ
ncbi:tetratricopeptide repeat protein [Mycobacterium sp. AMU20-3851]|uniref:tetratricopeptide repeat protein n=1 Tax=Mycobacterium sp. AMU20-3851 TaxID=3122055 RepID=UPI003754ED90